MMRLLCMIGVSLALIATSVVGQGSVASEEKAAGFTPLFNGTSLAGWRSYKAETAPAGWKAVSGELVRDGVGGDLMTTEQFTDFELRLEWKISKAGNSGIMFRVATTGEYPWSTGPEFQVLDNAGHKDGQSPLTSAGSNYAVHAPVKDVTRPVGEWNEARLMVRGAHVEHWMNGVKLLEYDIGSPDWDKRVKASKFGSMPGYGRAPRGHIVLQDHGDLVSFRNIRIKRLLHEEATETQRLRSTWLGQNTL